MMLAACGGSANGKNTSMTAKEFQNLIKESEKDIENAYMQANTDADVTIVFDIRDPEEEDDYTESKFFMMSQDDAGESEMIFMGYLHEFDDEKLTQSEYELKCFDESKADEKDYQITYDTESGSVFGIDGTSTFEILSYQTGNEAVIDDILEEMGY